MDDEILDAIEEDQEIAMEIEEKSVFSDIINGTLADIDVTLTVKVDATLQTKSRVSGDLNTSILSGKQSVRLPILEIPTFSGDRIEFCYLRGVLKGPALDLISGLSLSSSNYVKAVELLKDKFGNIWTYQQLCPEWKI